MMETFVNANIVLVFHQSSNVAVFNLKEACNLQRGRVNVTIICLLTYACVWVRAFVYVVMLS